MVSSCKEISLKTLQIKAFRRFLWHLLGESNPQLTLRSSPQSDMRELNQYKKVLILSDFSEVSLSIQDKP